MQCKTIQLIYSALLFVLLGSAVAPPRRAGAADVQDDAALGARPGAPKLVIDTQGFNAPVNSLDFSPGGDLLAAAGSDKVVRIWEVESGRLVSTIYGYDDDAGNGQCQVVRYSPDGKYLVVAVQDFSSAGAIRVYDTTDFSELQALLPGHPTGGVRNLAFSADGRYLASGGVDGGILFWDWTARRPVGQVAWNPSVDYFGFPHAMPVLSVFDAQGAHNFSAPHARELGRLNAGQRAELGTSDAIAGAQKAAQELGASLARLVPQAPDRGTGLKTVRVYPSSAPRSDGYVLFGGTAKRQGSDVFWAGLWALSGRRVQLYEDQRYIPSALALSPDAALAASADELGTIDVWSTRDGRRRFRFSGGGHAIYSAGFDRSGTMVLFGTEPYGSGRWNYNNYASLKQSFNLRTRVLSNVVPPVHPAPAQRIHGRELRFSRDAQTQTAVLTSRKENRTESFYSLWPGVTPLCFGYLGTAGIGIEDLLVFGCDDNALLGLDPTNTARGRRFVGHSSAVYAFGDSPDGRFLVSGSADRTLRLWSLARVRDMGWPDFDNYSNGAVYFLKPGGNAQRAGVRLGDIFVGIGGRALGTIFDRMMSGQRDYVPGQRATLDMMRDGRAYAVEVELPAAGDFVIPLLTLFVAGDEWVLWTPSGYYDASPGGDRLIGWKVNRGRARSALFYTAHQFRKQFYRPDVVDKILDTGDAARGLALANQERPVPPAPLDLRKGEDLRRVEPPRVVVKEPRTGTETRDEAVDLRADVTSQNGQPIGQVKVLLNGRPILGKELPMAPGDSAVVRRVALRIPLEPGVNTISVLATDRQFKSSSRPQEIVVERVTMNSAERQKPRAFVLAIGISDYANPDYRLEFAHRDAQAFADAWNAQSGKLYESVRTRVLLNKNATVAAIREGFDWLNSSVGPRDHAVIFIAAHGVGDASKGYYIASYQVDVKRLISTSIPDRDLIALVEGLRCRRTLVFIDTCHAGGIAGARPNAPEPLRELTSDELGAVLFGACKPRETSQEDAEWGHGAFTKALLETFHDPSKDLPPADGLLSIDELVFPLGRRVADLTGDEQHPVVARPPTIENFDFFAFEGLSDRTPSHRE